MNVTRLVAAGAFLVPFAAAASCGAAFCTVNTSWDAHGAWLEPGARFDLRYESIRQDQARSGTRNVGVGDLPRDHDEVRTVNRNLVAGVDYTLNADWGVNAQLPIVQREHLHEQAGVPESWDFTRAGDARLLVRRRLASYEDAEAHTLGTAGVHFGLKLPTGQTNVRNGDGELAERTLQPGSGTTDLLAGGYYSKELAEQNLSWFAQALAQLPLNSRNEYRPGNRFTVDVGARYALGERLGVMLQVNALYRARDRGAEAEPEDSGGKFLFLSPGLSYAFSPKLQAYAFLQLPVYQDVNGVQLVARHSLAMGLGTRF